ncbi:MAG TPA: 50S ribosomal protein L15 [Methylomirabilota bacterium]|nr:50S ribosomal protein L15 [Methylomirabilota bacterium]
MDLSSLRPAPGANKKRKRVGRGPGSGLGKTSGRGHKGKGARSGGNTPPGYEGGQMPLSRRLPKRGFRNPFRKEYQIINLGALERFSAGAVIDNAALREAGLIRGDKKVKILADGELTKALTIKAQAFSGKAREKITALGGTVEVV